MGDGRTQPAEEPVDPGQVRQVLVVANRSSGSAQLHAALYRRGREAPSHFHVLVPVTPMPEHEADLAHSEHLIGYSDEHPGLTMARYRLHRLLDVLGELGLDAEGEVGDSDPFVAVRAKLATVSIDEIVLATLSAARSSWLQDDLLRRLRTACDVPLAHVEARPTISTGPRRRRLTTTRR